MEVSNEWAGMNKFLAVLSLVLVVAASPAVAQELLPASLSDWKSPTASLSVRPNDFAQLSGTDPAILREYGAVAVERRPYARGSETLSVTLYRLRDSTGAYGLFTYLLSDQMSASDLAQYSALSHGRALAVAGNWLLEATGDDLRPLTGDLKTLAAQLSARADRTPYPTIGQHLPLRGKTPNSERYLQGPVALQHLLPLGNGDWIGFAEGAEAVLARYRTDGQEATLLLVAYPTPQAAARKLDELGHWLPLNPTGEFAGDRAPVFARRTSSLLALVAQTRSQTFADSLLQQIHYESQITWNEPSRKATEPNIGQFLVGTFIGTGIILLFALVAGIGFGGVRILVKYFFPGKVFDRATHVEILQLGLSSKPIEAKDFY